ncbi:MAG: ABC transporter permease subunit [Acetobacteraceae bacterium]|nr:ABC transporter permease subunit [Acetobacteraceae bacterium]
MPQWLIDYWALMGFGPTGWGLSMLRAAGMTIAVSSAGFALGSVLGALAAWGRLSGSRTAAAISAAYTTVIRGVPELLVIYLVFFGGAVVLGWIWRTFWDGRGLRLAARLRRRLRRRRHLQRRLPGGGVPRRLPHRRARRGRGGGRLRHAARPRLPPHRRPPGASLRPSRAWATAGSSA